MVSHSLVSFSFSFRGGESETESSQSHSVQFCVQVYFALVLLASGIGKNVCVSTRATCAAVIFKCLCAEYILLLVCQYNLGTYKSFSSARWANGLRTEKEFH